VPPLRRSRKARRKQANAITALFSARNLDDFPGLVNGIYFSFLGGSGWRSQAARGISPNPSAESRAFAFDLAPAGVKTP
jgi:hypothetical protein